MLIKKVLLLFLSWGKEIYQNGGGYLQLMKFLCILFLIMTQVMIKKIQNALRL